MILIVVCIRKFEDSLKEANPNISDEEILMSRDKDFNRWLKHQVSCFSLQFKC